MAFGNRRSEFGVSVAMGERMSWTERRRVRRTRLLVVLGAMAVFAVAVPYLAVAYGPLVLLAFLVLATTVFGVITWTRRGWMAAGVGLGLSIGLPVVFYLLARALDLSWGGALVFFVAGHMALYTALSVAWRRWWLAMAGGVLVPWVSLLVLVVSGFAGSIALASVAALGYTGGMLVVNFVPAWQEIGLGPGVGGAEEVGRCLACGYDCWGLPRSAEGRIRCPECGGMVWEMAAGAAGESGAVASAAVAVAGSAAGVMGEAATGEGAAAQAAAVEKFAEGPRAAELSGPEADRATGR